MALHTAQLDMARIQSYLSPVAEKNATGFSSLMWSGEEPQFFMKAAFFMSAHVPYGRAGWESREALPVLHRSANPFGSAHPFSSGRRFVKRTGAHVMTHQSQGTPVPATLAFQSTQFDIVERNGQPWLRGQQVADALGYKNKRQAIDDLYSRNAAEFTDSMTVLVELETAGGRQKVRVFSLRGAHLLGMFARTEKAAEFRHWVLDILDRETQAEKISLTNRRWLISYDHNGKEQVTAVPPDASVMSVSELLKAINEPNGIYIETSLLAEFIETSVKRLALRCKYHEVQSKESKRAHDLNIGQAKK